MPTPALSREECFKAVQAVDEAVKKGYVVNGRPSAVRHAAGALGMNVKAIEHRIYSAQHKWGDGLHLQFNRQKLRVAESTKRIMRLEQAETPEPKLPDFPDDDIAESEIIDLMCRRYEKRAEHKASKKWFRIEMPDDQPFAVLWWGDPHLDNNGTNWPLLKAHAQLARHPRVYSVNIGDTLDNWPNGSRLMSLYAQSDQSVATSHKLARWYCKNSGIRWLVWLFGNHDAWAGMTSTEWLREMGGRKIVMEDWGAQFVLACPGGAEFKLWAAHNFPGHSQWNSLHGPQKAASMREEADLYVCGHLHNWAIHKEESSQRGFTYSLVRARGYKYLDDYAEKLGFMPQQNGASIMTVFLPATSRHYNFEHPEDGIAFLDAVRAA